MRSLLVAAFLILAAAAPAAEPGSNHDADVAAKAAQLEMLRVRAATTPNATTSTTLIEADNLLSQYRAAPPAKRDPLRAQLDAALARLDLEISGAQSGR
ncbi:hypothetical protein [Magnetospirillum sp. UT-4]|uniref:hypothetical protein n=1 Tax=Magnetospirillum sp. UT-4 TaxID=2681467 RepID=UPI00137DC003|nr:hypothetical protein [Magnetospirillum sp. UT-4]CAA7619932.1 conserved exported hypothetical protein [Magnetospirillum sp. UT-4]